MKLCKKWALTHYGEGPLTDTFSIAEAVANEILPKTYESAPDDAEGVAALALAQSAALTRMVGRLLETLHEQGVLLTPSVLAVLGGDYAVHSNIC